MALRVVHINRETISREAEVKALWEEVLHPKWDAQARIKAQKLFCKLRPGETPSDPGKLNA
jgi:hypothetical protein